MAADQTPRAPDEQRKSDPQHVGKPGGSGTSSTGANLLYGLLALQVNYIDQPALVEVIRAWIADRSRPIREILQGRGGVPESRLQLLDRFYEDYLASQKGDAEQGMADLTRTQSLLPELDQLHDAEVQKSLHRLAETRSLGGSTDPEIRIPPGAGQPETVRLRIDYQLMTIAGRGGLGDVTTALETDLSRIVVLKTIKERYRDHYDYQARFRLEAEVCGRLEHPGVVPVHCLGVSEDGVSYFAMRYLPEGDLRSRLEQIHGRARRNEPEPSASERAVEFRGLLTTFVQVCNATAYAHARGVIHRDIKPANILVGDYGEALLADWGLAKIIGREESEEISQAEATLRPSSGSSTAPSQVGQTIGTMEYMSPEQARGEPHNHGFHTDIFLLGSTLYTILVGHSPYHGAAKEENAKLVRFRPPRQINPEIPAAIEAICLKAMMADPRDRYHTAKALAADVNRFLADEPVSVYRDPVGKRVMRWVKRHRQVVAAACVLAVVGVIGLIADDVRVGREKERTQDALGKVSIALSREKIARDLALGSAEQLYAKAAIELARTPGSESSRVAMADLFVYSFEQLLRRSPNLRVRLGAFKANHEAANLSRLTDDFDTAAARYARAFVLVDGLLEEFSEASETITKRTAIEINHAMLEVDFGEFLRMKGDYAGAEKHFGKAVEEISPLRKQEPKSADFVFAEASARMNLADSYYQQGRYDVARIAIREAIGILNQSGIDSQKNDQFANLMIAAIYTEAATSRELGERETAIKSCDAAITLARSKPFESDPNYGYWLAMMLFEKAQAQEQVLATRKEAAENLASSLKILDRLVQVSPVIAEYRRVKAEVSGRLAELLFQAGDASTAEARAKSALEDIDRLLKARELPIWRSIKGQILATQGRIAAARKKFDEARTLFTTAIEEYKRALDKLPSRQIDRAAVAKIERERDALGK